MIKNGKKDYSWNTSTCICENGKYIKFTAVTSVIACDEIKCRGYYINKCHEYCVNKFSQKCKI